MAKRKSSHRSAPKATKNSKPPSSPAPTVQPTRPPEPVRGLLPGDLIEELNLIDPSTWNAGCLRSSSYNLRFGSTYYPCDDPNVRDPIAVPRDFHVEGFESILFSTEEVIDLTGRNDVVARFGLKMRFALQGLILQAGPQVEPGYKGPLFGLLYNTANTPVAINRHEEFLTIEFEVLGKPPSNKMPVNEPCPDLATFMESRELGPGKRNWHDRENILKIFSEQACKKRHDELEKSFAHMLSGKAISQNKLMIGLMVLAIILSLVALFKDQLTHLVAPPQQNHSQSTVVPREPQPTQRDPLQSPPEWDSNRLMRHATETQPSDTAGDVK